MRNYFKYVQTKNVLQGKQLSAVLNSIYYQLVSNFLLS
jgi:hypothetical protein